MPKFASHSERAAFEWAQTLPLELIDETQINIAYRLNSKSCIQKPIPCKRNCRANPKCIYGLGEKRWLSSKEEDFFTDYDNPNEERKKENSNVGLKNLGATCYVNSLLQVWFHNPFLREAIYKWKPEHDPKEIKEQFNRSLSEFNISNKDKTAYFTPVSPLGQLQLIFARLQFSLRCFVDPTQFVNSLDLDVSTQQDAQEFSKLFLNLIEEDLRHQKNLEVKNIVQKQYCGEYVYITICQKCLKESKTPSKFYELSLNIKGHKDIYECLEEFFAPEVLDGCNQFFCNNCQSKQDVVRNVKLQKLPPYLNLQLLRFVFDRQKGREKLNSMIKFPETLSLKQYFDESVEVPRKVEYKLCAVLMHRGQSAHSGHYIAQIKDRITDNWFKFNDEFVEKIEGKHLKLGSEEIFNELLNKNTTDEKNSLKLSKGQYASDDAYMLVYKNSLLDDTLLPPDNSEKWDIPDYLQTVLLEDNSKFEERIEIYNQMKNENLAFNKEKQIEIKSIFEYLTKNDNIEECEWISKQWIINWLSFDSTKQIPPIDNSKAICVHSKLAICAIDQMKLVNSEALSRLYNKYSGGPRLKDVLCRECVENKARSIQIRHKINEDSKQITSLLKFSLPIAERSYWVGKESLKIWKQLALRNCDNLEKNLMNTDFNENNSPSALSKSNSVNNSSSENGDSDSENKPPIQSCDNNNTDLYVEKLNFNFNEDILCIHGYLSPDENRKKLVSYSVWNLLKSHFHNASEFDSSSSFCQECFNLSLTNQCKKNELKQFALLQKQQLQDLYLQKKKITSEEMQLNCNYYALNLEFFNQWKNFIKDISHYKKPSFIDNNKLLCVHQLLFYPPSKFDHNASDFKYIILTEIEWQKLSEFYTCNCIIKITAKLNDRREKIITSEPESCLDCYTELKQLEREKLLKYDKAVILVRFVQNKCDGEENEQSLFTDDDQSDKSFLEFGNKKLKKLTSEDVSSFNNDGIGPRRSTRKRKYRDVKEFTVSSDLTLLQLKVQIMKEFKVPTFDQNLFLNDKFLEGNDFTLSQLNVIPNSLICLRADEPAGGFSICDEEYLKGTKPETGFKGTKLCNREEE